AGLIWPPPVCSGSVVGLAPSVFDGSRGAGRYNLDMDAPGPVTAPTVRATAIATGSATDGRLTAAATSTRPAVLVEGLTRRFGSLTAVDAISFEVGTGEVFGFLGPNGAGKSTTIGMLCTLLRPSDGRAMVNGFDVAREANAVRRSIGMIFQDPSLDN